MAPRRDSRALVVSVRHWGRARSGQRTGRRDHAWQRRALGSPQCGGTGTVSIGGPPVGAVDGGEFLARQNGGGFAPGLQVGVAPMPVDTALFTPGAWPRTPTLLAVGRLNEQKGVSDCIQLLAQLPDAVTADIVGDGPDRDRLHTMARTLGVGGRIRWHGRLPQSAVAPLYRGALATVMPSRDEGLGLVAVESLLSETPVVAYRSGGIVDLIVDGETGLLTREGSVDELAAAVMQLLDNPASAERMGAAGRARMLSAFSPATAAATYHAVYQAAVR